MRLDEWFEQKAPTVKKTYVAEKLGITPDYLWMILRWHSGDRECRVQSISHELAAKIACFTGGHVSIVDALFPHGVPKYPVWAAIEAQRPYRRHPKIS